MTREDVIRMAREVYGSCASEQDYIFGNMIAAAERKKYFSNLQGEALLGEYSVQLVFESHDHAKIAINAIRARGQS